MPNAEPDWMRLRKIYEHFDQQNFKQGLKLITQTEAKYPQSVLLKVLKALALQRTDRATEAQSLASEVISSGASLDDSGIYQPLGMVLKAGNRWGEWLAVLSRVSASAGGSDPELAEQLTCAQLRLRRFAEVQKTSNAAFQRTKDIKHSFQAIMAMLLQVPEGGRGLDELGAMERMPFELASRMLAKLCSDGKCNTQELAWLSIHTLRRQKRTDAVLDYMASPQAAEIIALDEDRLEIVSECLRDVQDWRRLNGVLRLLLSSDRVPEVQHCNWRWWEEYFESVEELLAAPPPADSPPLAPIVLRHGQGPLELQCDADWDAAARFVASLQPPEDDRAPAKRSKPLAHLNLLWRRVRRGDSSAGGAPVLAEGVLRYLERYRWKQQASLDVLRILPDVAGDPAAAAALVDGINAARPGETETEQLARALCLARMRCGLGVCEGLSDADLLAEVEQLCQLSDRTAPLDPGLERFERCAGDDALLAACSLLMRRFCTSGGQMRWALHAALVLERARRAENNSSLQLWRMVVYAILGVTREDVFREFDVKYIQHESLSYLLLGPRRRSGVTALLVDLLGKILQMHGRFQEEGPELEHDAWQRLTCSKVFEVEAFREKLRCSANHAECAVESVAATLFREHTQTLATARTFLTSTGVATLLGSAADALQGGIRCNEDTACLDLVLLVPPRSAAGEELRARLLRHSNALHPPPQRAALLRARLASLQSLQALLRLGGAPQAAKPSGGGGKKGKDKKDKAAPPQHADPAPAEPDAAASRAAAAAAASAAAAAAGDDGLPAACSHLCAPPVAAACWRLVAAAHRTAQAVVAAEGGPTPAEAAAAAAVAMRELGAALEPTAAAWQSRRLRAPSDAIFALLETVPTAVLCLTAAARHAEGLGGGAGALAAAAGELADAADRLHSAADGVLQLISRPGEGAAGAPPQGMVLLPAIARLSAECGESPPLPELAADPGDFPSDPQLRVPVAGRLAGAWSAAIDAAGRAAREQGLALRGLARALG